MKSFFQSLFVIIIISGFLFLGYSHIQSKRAEIMQFELISNSVGPAWVSASGRITAVTPKAFMTFLNKTNLTEKQPLKDTQIILNSSEGNIWAAVELGKLIRDARLNTAVGITSYDKKYDEFHIKNGECISACVFAFLGGINREVRTGVLGFKNLYTKYTTRPHGNKKLRAMEYEELTKTLNGYLIAYISEMGADPQLLSIPLIESGKKLTLNDLALKKFNIIWDDGTRRQTRFGELSVRNCQGEVCKEHGSLFSQSLFLGEIQIAGIGPSGISIENVFNFPDYDAALIATFNGGTACPALFRFVRIDKNGTQASEEFGNCSDLVTFSKLENSIRVKINKDIYFYSNGTVKGE